MRRRAGQPTFKQKRNNTQHSARNLNLIIDTTPIGVVGCIRLCPHLVAHVVLRPRRDITFQTLLERGLRLVKHCWWNLAHPLSRIPDLYDNIKDVLIDTPRRAAEDIKSSKNVLHFAVDRRLLEISLLLGHFP